MTPLTLKHRHLNGGTEAILVNLDRVDAIKDDPMGGGSTLYWMAGQTSWDVTETLEEIHRLANP